jgi:hypothetical protein
MLMRCRKMEEREVQRLRDQVRQWQEQREERTAALVKLTAKKDTLDRMRQDARKDYQRQIDLLEQHRADEIFQMTFARRPRNALQRRSA